MTRRKDPTPPEEAGNATDEQPVEQHLPAVRPEGAIANPLTTAPQYWTSIRPDEEGAKSLIAQAFSAPAHSAQDWLDKPFPTWHVFGHHASKVDAVSGEVVQLTRTVLISPTGTMLEMFSDIVVRDISFLCQLYGQPPWSPALPLKLIRRKTSGPGYCYRLVLDFPPNKELYK